MNMRLILPVRVFTFVYFFFVLSSHANDHKLCPNQLKFIRFVHILRQKFSYSGMLRKDFFYFRHYTTFLTDSHRGGTKRAFSSFVLFVSLPGPLYN